MTTNVLVRDLDLAAPHVDDARRLEVVVDGFNVISCPLLSPPPPGDA